MDFNYFCSKCGKHYEFYHEICEICNEHAITKYDDNQYLVKRICLTCKNSGVITNKPSFFDKNPLCNICGSPLKPIEIHNGAPNFKIGGTWNGKNIGKKIQEKNEQLKKRHAGMEGDEKNLRREINIKSKNIFGKNETT